ncbi:MAG: amino acid adenylation domain-containing protein [Rhodobacteraceae bacterium]|nr:amino acid adenylation domain-containing protein [Paracoccaceae bacterium]
MSDRHDRAALRHGAAGAAPAGALHPSGGPAVRRGPGSALARAGTVRDAPALYGPVVPIPEGVSLASLFADRVRAGRGEVALIHGERRITFGELDLCAEAVALALERRGVGAGDIVGVCLTRGPDLIAALLGVIRLGAAYVPLDPGNPAERLRYIVEDSGVEVILSTEALGNRFGLPGLLDVATLAPAAAVSARAPVDPRAPLYVTYTSGSTGKPKGVVGTHRATVNRLNWMYRAFPFRAGEVMCQKTPISFVDSVWEMFGPLMAGIPLVIIDPAHVADPVRMMATLGRAGVTRLLVVPSLLRAILDAEIDFRAVAPAVWLVSVSGEKLPAELARRFLAAAPGVALMNIYGSSEVAADVTYELVEEVEGDEVPIGRAIDNVRLYILDEDMNPVPEGETGQLFVGGEVLAAGYHRAPDRTAARFLPDPFNARPGARMFQTGDLVAALPDGRLLFRGRADDQVKVRGHRVELGDVEHALAGLPGVAEAAVAFRRDGEGEGHLAGFVVLEDGATAAPEVLRQGLAAHLPDYMMPDWIEILPALPLNPNGKLDRPALAARPRPAVAGRLAGPETPTEAEMMGIWLDVLGLPRIGRDSNFFDLGGNSLVAVRLFTRIRRTFGLDCPIAVLLQHPTVRDLSAFVDRERAAPRVAFRLPVTASDPWDTTTVIHAGPARGAGLPVFVAGGVGGNVNNLYHLGRLIGQTRPVIGLQTRGVMGHDPLPTIEAMAADHITWIRARQPTGPYVIAGYSGGAFTALEITRQLEAAGERVAHLVILDSYAPGVSETPADPSGGGRRLARELALLRERGLWHFGERLGAFLRKTLVRGPVLRGLRPFWPAYAMQMKSEQDWLRAAAHYAGGPVAAPLLLIRGEPMNGVQREMMARLPSFGWDGFADPARIAVTDVRGDHLRMIEGEGAVMIADAMARALAA